MRRFRYVLETPNARLPMPGGSALLGRSLDCDVVIADERASRHHALVRVVEDGVEVVPLSPHLITLNGAKLDAPRALSDGDDLAVVGHHFVLRREEMAAPASASLWFIERDPGVLVAVGDERVTVGGGPDDRLVIPGWEPAAVALEVVGDRLVLEVKADGVSVDRPRQSGDLVTVASGVYIAHRGTSLRVIALPADPSKPTSRPALEALPSAVTLAFLPRGGNLSVTVGERTRRAYLAEKRCEFVACLLQPLAPYRVGDLIPDDALAERLWVAPRCVRTEINTLVWRVRKDLAGAGLGDVPLLERSGGGVRLCLAEGGTARVVAA